MTFISHRHTCCADPACAYRGTLKLLRESWDGREKCVVGEEVCPQCDCHMLFSRRLTREEKIEWGNDGQHLYDMTKLYPVFVSPTPCPACGSRMYAGICQNYGCEALMPDYAIEWPTWSSEPTTP